MRWHVDIDGSEVVSCGEGGGCFAVVLGAARSVWDGRLDLETAPGV